MMVGNRPWVTGGLFVIESITTNHGFGVDDFPLGEKYDGRKSPMGYWWVICHRIYHNKSWVWSPFIGEKYDGQKSPMGY
jgi:hypothetical protein